MIHFTDTLKGQKRPFEPIVPGEVKMYVCGPTVYNTVHIGNARPAVVFDSLRRFLELEGFRVTYAQNFTDIDDKIIDRMEREGWDFDTITHTYIRAFRKDMQSLGVREPSFQPRTTHFLDAMIQFIDTLISKGHAYVVEGDVFFDVNSFEEYGALSHRKVKDMQAGSRIEVDARKKHSADFALWKTAKKGEPYWDSPWGRGRPGWHIECSAMACSLLGERFDIHAGGNDLVFPHHENERAQSEARFEKVFANYWLHNGMLQLSGSKMAKSTGNIIAIQEGVRKYGRDAIRLFFFSAHYRNPIEYSDEILLNWKTASQRMYQSLEEIRKEIEPYLPIRVQSPWMKEQIRLFHEALRDDFNTPKAVSMLFDMPKQLRGQPSSRKAEAYFLMTEYFAEVLGLFDTEQLEQDQMKNTAIDAMIQHFIDLRAQARKEKDFEQADGIRKHLLSLGIELLDSADGTTRYRWNDQG